MKRFGNLFAASFLVILGFPLLAEAHDYDGGSLGADAGATDLHIVVCSDESGPTEHLFFHLTAGRPASAPLVSGQIQVPDPRLAVSSTDPINGDAQSSRPLEVAAGDTVYYITIDKSGPGQAGYSFTYHCETANGVETGTNLTTLQDQ